MSKQEEKNPQHRYSWLTSIRLTIISFGYAYRANILSLFMGILFGYLMSHAGATTFDYHAEMFLLTDLQLMKVIGTAVVVAMIGVSLLKKFHINSITTGTEVDFVKKPYQQGLIAGAFLFGIGWAMTASCPGTVPAMLGEGKISALFTLIGLLLGTMAYGVLQTFIASQGRYGDVLKD
ncbi:MULTISPECIES: YeeE/YedE thiosulfate transporter family protein [Thiomicrorhabdus]|uniref:YeeE/YedE family protein n=1 Tax=Thiomicrorhabdus heinhorstiae TaxID=2748010 RepID=A0ABS0BUF8_9GAMM|nr:MULTISPECIES: YeeE/YedE thiosulfate transporter family protein [Thiomicrorhabdus]MBF6057472.1 YeeE/YedE family protein [Thiomicrorhabdus heinhorstiae]